MRDVPRQSHFRFDYVIPFRLAEALSIWGMGWGDFNFKTYVQTQPQRSEAEVIRKLNQVALVHKCPAVVRGGAVFSIQRLEDVYLNPIGPYDIPLGSKTQVIVFSMIALFIALIAGINFINLATARAEKRAREIGVRRVIGADRRQIAAQFFGESLLITGLAVPLALLLAWVAMPCFNELTGKEFSLQLVSPDVWISLTGIAGLVGLLSGVFPALYLSGIQPLHAFKEAGPLRSAGGSRTAGWVGRGALRRILVTVQFVIAITLIVATLVVDSQLQKIREESWRLDQDQIVTVPMKENVGRKYDLFRSELLKSGAIADVAAKDWKPIGMKNDTTDVWWEGKTQDQAAILMGTTQIDANFFTTMDMDLVAGRGFSAAFPGDREAAYVLNELAVEKAGLQDAVGKSFAVGRRKGTVVGVVKNTICQSLRLEPRPEVYYPIGDFAEECADGTVFIRIRGGRALSAVMAHIRSLEPRQFICSLRVPFPRPADRRPVRGEQRLGKAVRRLRPAGHFHFLLGLLGLVAFTAEQRTKEIGIRRALRASVPRIVSMLCREYLVLVALANVVAWPIAYISMRRWLEGFVYRTDIGIGLLLPAGLAALLIALCSVSVQAVRAARANPVDSLRYE